MTREIWSYLIKGSKKLTQQKGLAILMTMTAKAIKYRWLSSNYIYQFRVQCVIKPLKCVLLEILMTITIVIVLLSLKCWPLGCDC